MIWSAGACSRFVWPELAPAGSPPRRAERQSGGKPPHSKRYATILLLRFAAAFLGSLLAFVAAAQRPAPQNLRPRGYVNDFAGVVDSQWKQRIERLSSEVERRTGAQIAVVAIRSLQGEPIEDFTNQLFIAWGVGHKDNKGAMLLLAVQERRMRLEIGYGLEPLVPDGYAGSVLREMRPALREGHYGEALYNGVYTVASRIAEKSGTALDEASPRPASGQTPQGVVWLLRAFLLLVFGFLLFARRASRPGGVWYVAGSTFGGWSGGFGGYDGGGGGGGFGGFGGGSSGGGGASSSW